MNSAIHDQPSGFISLRTKFCSYKDVLRTVFYYSIQHRVNYNVNSKMIILNADTISNLYTTRIVHS